MRAEDGRYGPRIGSIRRVVPQGRPHRPGQRAQELRGVSRRGAGTRRHGLGNRGSHGARRSGRCRCGSIARTTRRAPSFGCTAADLSWETWTPSIRGQPALPTAAGAVVISVGYRVAPENRFPAALDDAYAVLTWAAENAAELGIDPERIAVGGHSAGAGLAAAAALRARDERGPSICFQLLNQPGLDDRQQTWSAQHFTETPWMNRDKVTAIVAALPGLGARLGLRRPGPGRRSVRSATRVHHYRGVLSEPRRRHRVRAAAAAGGRVGRSAPVGRHVPRIAGDPVGRGISAAARRTRRSAAPGPCQRVGLVMTVTRLISSLLLSTFAATATSASKSGCGRLTAFPKIHPCGIVFL